MIQQNAKNRNEFVAATLAQMKEAFRDEDMDRAELLLEILYDEAFMAGWVD